MRSSRFTQFLFLLYCLDVGLLLVLLPWSPAWEHHFVQISQHGLRSWLLAPWPRALLTGFGFLHLGWGVHDLIRFSAARTSSPHGEA